MVSGKKGNVSRAYRLTQENHQDYICMTMITAGAAMLAAVFFIFNLGHSDNSTGSAWTATGDRAKQQSITDVATYGDHSVEAYGDHSVEAYGDHSVEASSHHATTVLKHPATTQPQLYSIRPPHNYSVEASSHHTTTVLQHRFSTRMWRRAWGQTKWTAQCR